ncbi:DNA-binding response regulator [Serratia marcescens]|nr:DNA-binding response regulator [Serratia marcescens]
MNAYRVLIVDDHQLIIHGVRTLLSAYPRYQIVGYIENGLSVYAACNEFMPDIVVLDLGLPGLGGLEVIEQLCQRWPRLRILVLTAVQDEITASRAIRAGAMGYVLKTSSQMVLLSAITHVVARKCYLDPDLDPHLIAQLSNEEGCGALLTRRERQVLQLISEGNANRNIAELLNISIKTVETHRLNTMRKLNAHKVTELLQSARRLGLLNAV